MHGPDVDDATLRRIVDLLDQERNDRAVRRERILQPAQAGGALRDGDIVAGVQDERLAVAAVRLPPVLRDLVAKAGRSRLPDECDARVGRH